MKNKISSFFTGECKMNCFRNILFAAIAVMTMVLVSCYEPSPLYGRWADNEGNSITFISDGTFVAKINDKTDKPVNYQGEYSVIENVLIFNYTVESSVEGGTPSSYTIDTEWDIRGSILYCTWTADGLTKTLTLYHSSK